MKRSLTLAIVMWGVLPLALPAWAGSAEDRVHHALDRVYETFRYGMQTQDASRFAALFAEDARWINTGLETRGGRDAVEEFYTWEFNTLDSTLKERARIVEGNRGFTELHYEGAHRDLDIPLEMAIGLMITVNPRGRIQTYRLHLDTAAVVGFLDQVETATAQASN